MLRNTFCHIPGIGTKSELNLWAQGILSWDDIMKIPLRELFGTKNYFLRYRLLESSDHLADRDPNYFADLLPASELWRLYGEFRSVSAYLDIETNGLAAPNNAITTIAMYDGRTVFHYVKGRNLDRFVEDIRQYKVIVTYNGKSFDVPVIENHFGIKLHQAHIDLRYVLKSLGYSGGLKGCEKKMGIDRKELDGMDGYFAVLLWKDFIANRNGMALQTLLSYNVLDAANLEMLMVMAYNLKLKETPFFDTHALKLPLPVKNPFEPDLETIARIMGENDRYF
ncbi:MAG: ribonuclease H-like domain-containing protein [Desulfomonile tiedjei]|nr:ribonuclease H-like domain-containing protein [Desulfomonile tiedjei]